jgi:octaprenyl-diphosphate synthase
MVGLAFQIRDDILDYTGRRSITGKPTGLDLSDKKLTLPLIHALREAPRAESKSILAAIKDGGKKANADRVLEFVLHHQGIEYASRRAREFSTRAVELLTPLPESPGKAALKNFASFVIEREK